MKLKTLTVSISEKLNVGNYETISPFVSIEAQIEEGDDLSACSTELFQSIKSSWAKQALQELAWVAQRRAHDQQKTHEYNELTKGTRAQLKAMLQKP